MLGRASLRAGRGGTGPAGPGAGASLRLRAAAPPASALAASCGIAGAGAGSKRGAGLLRCGATSALASPTLRCIHRTRMATSRTLFSFSSAAARTYRSSDE